MKWSNLPLAESATIHLLSICLYPLHSSLMWLWRWNENNNKKHCSVCDGIAGLFALCGKLETKMRKTIYGDFMAPYDPGRRSVVLSPSFCTCYVLARDGGYGLPMGIRAIDAPCCDMIFFLFRGGLSLSLTISTGLDRTGQYGSDLAVSIYPS